MPKDLFYGKLDRGTHKTGCPLLHFKNVCKRDMKSAAIDIESLWSKIAPHGGILSKRESSMQSIHKTCNKWRREISEKPWGHSGTTQYNFQMWKM